MTTVTDHYEITGSVPFVNVHVDGDSPLFLDPSAIRNSSSTWATRAHSQLVGFFNEVVTAARSAAPADHARGRELLSHLHEPNETRLGLSLSGSRGRAFGSELEERLWRELRANPACQNAVLTRLEETPMFIRAVGNDRISDMTTRIVFNVLADFTADMMTKFPTLNAGASTADSDVWDPSSLNWTSESYTLPHCFGKQLLLVPLDHVYWQTLMRGNQFYNRFSSEVVKEERTVINAKGKRLGPSKRSIREENPDYRKLNNDKAVEYKAQRGRDLVSEYRSFVDNNYTPITEDEATRRMRE